MAIDFSLGYMDSGQTITPESGLSYTKNYYQFTIPWLVGFSVDYTGCETGMVFDKYAHDLLLQQSSADKLSWPKTWRKGLPTLELLTYLSYLASKVTLTKEEYLPMTGKKKLKPYNKNWRIKYVVRSHCHSWGRETKKNFHQKNIFPQKSSLINFLFKISV